MASSLWEVECTRPPGGRLRPRRAAPRRDAWRALSDASAPSIRQSSATTPSPSSASTVVSAVSVSADFSMRKWVPASAAICGRCVMHRTCRPSPSARSRSPTARAVWPPTPASTSSNTSVRDSPAPATVMSASMTRESSPPDAASRMGAAGTPGLGASRNSTRSLPVGADLLPGLQHDLERRALHRQRVQLLADALGELRRRLLSRPRHLPGQLGAARRAPPPARPPARSVSISACASRACSSRQRSACASTAATLPPCFRSRRS